MNATLTKESQQLQLAIGRGLAWLETYADPAKRLATVNELGKLRRRAKRLEQAAGLRPAVAMFGQSQVGKSFLVSNLARTPEQKQLEISPAGYSVDEIRQILKTEQAGQISFIDHINPKSENNEATGVITRFTTNYSVEERGYKIRLFSQADLVKVLTTAYQYNIQDSHYLLDEVTIRKTVVRIQDLAANRSEGVGMTPDDVLDIRDFLRDNLFDKGLVQRLHQHGYWDEIADYVPRLDPALRHEAFGFLWHTNPFLTSLFKQLSDNLNQLGFVSEVWCGLDAIAPTTHTIVDVNRLSELNHLTENKGEVLVRTNAGQMVSVNRSVLTALAAELVLPLPKVVEQHPDRQFLQHADILDFPGARSWEQKSREAFDESETADKMTTFLRGKVAYLFDKYNETFEISSLLFCHDNSQVEVNSLPGLLYKWIGVNVGKSAEERERREAALVDLIPAEVRGELRKVNPFFFILTKINENLNKSDITKAGQPQEHDQKWNSRLVKNYSNFMKKATTDNWTEQWNMQGGALKNTFIIRDPTPKFSRPCYAVDSGAEVIETSFKQVFGDLRASFVNSPDVVRHFYDPARMWQEAIEPGQNGLAYLMRFLMPACHPAIKSEQIRVALDTLRQEIGRELCAHYEGGSVEEKLRRARERRERVVRPIGRLVMEKQLGQFLASMTIAEQYVGGQDGGIWDRELLRQVMNSPEAFMKQPARANGHDTDAPSSEKNLDGFLKGLLGNFDPQPTTAPTPTPNKIPTLADRYAENLLGKWVIQLKDSADNSVFLRRFGLAKEEADIVVEEMVRSMERDGLQGQLAGRVTTYMGQISNLEIVLSIGRATVNEFVKTLGWSRVGADDKNRNRAVYQPKPNQVVPIFDDVATAIPEKPDLQTDIDDPARQLYSQWFSGFYGAFEYNVLRESNLSDPERARINGLLEAIIQTLNYAC